MAYMNQERKALIAQELKKVVPAQWKYTLAVRNSSTIVMTITQAPVDLIGECLRVSQKYETSVSKTKERPTNLDINQYYLDRQFDGDLLALFRQFMDALNLRNVQGKENWDKSDIMTDYFNVGWYVDLNIGSWNRPFLDVIPLEQQPMKSGVKPFVMKPSGVNAPDFDTYKAFLPEGWESMSPGKKAAATKKAKAFAATYS